MLFVLNDCQNSYRFQCWSQYMVSIIGIILNIILIEWPKLLIPCHLSTIYKKKSFNNNFYTHTANKWTIWLLSRQQRMTRSAQPECTPNTVIQWTTRAIVKLDSGFPLQSQCTASAVPGTNRYQCRRHTTSIHLPSIPQPLDWRSAL